VDGLTRLNVLVVDHDPWARTNVTSALDDSGIRCGEASNGVTGMRKALADAPHVVILGSALPELSTPELMLGLRTDPRTCHAAIVGVDDVVDADACLRLPCSSVEVLATLVEALEVRRQAAVAAPTRSVTGAPVGAWPPVEAGAARSSARTRNDGRATRWGRRGGIETLQTW
jgi:DNA-binding response OmpR family regulator